MRKRDQAKLQHLIHATVEKVPDQETDNQSDGTSLETECGESLTQKYLNHGGSSLHLPVSLDQYYYHSLPATDSKTSDQVLYRYQETIPQDRLVCMVDQLWLHVFDSSMARIRC